LWVLRLAIRLEYLAILPAAEKNLVFGDGADCGFVPLVRPSGILPPVTGGGIGNVGRFLDPGQLRFLLRLHRLLASIVIVLRSLSAGGGGDQTNEHDSEMERSAHGE
jgi:hypothetical protein